MFTSGIMLQLDENAEPGLFDLDYAKGAVKAVERALAHARENLEVANAATLVSGEEGDDPVDVFAVNLGLELRREMAMERVIRLEGVLRFAQRRVEQVEAWS